MDDLRIEIENLSVAATLPHVLVVDDDERLRDLLVKFLRDHDFIVTSAKDANDARLKIAHFDFDMIVLDVMMPGENGMELTRSLKLENVLTPILLLTALEGVESRIQGLESGADDYLPKPFEPRELLLRIHAILRRAQAKPVIKDRNENLQLGKWTVDFTRGELISDDQRQLLTNVEQSLLMALAERKNQVISREDLAHLCHMDAAAERTIDVQITRLRKKVEEDSKMPRYIQTVRGQGYVLRPD